MVTTFAYIQSGRSMETGALGFPNLQVRHMRLPPTYTCYYPSKITFCNMAVQVFMKRNNPYNDYVGFYPSIEADHGVVIGTSFSEC